MGGRCKVLRKSMSIALVSAVGVPVGHADIFEIDSLGAETAEGEVDSSRALVKYARCMQL